MDVFTTPAAYEDELEALFFEVQDRRIELQEFDDLEADKAARTWLPLLGGFTHG